MLKEALLAEFDHEMAATRRLLERLPDDRERLAWKPHPKSMSFGALGTHIASLPVWGTIILDAAFFDLAARPPAVDEKTSRREILSAFDENSRRTRAGMDRTDAEYLDRWTLRRGTQEMFSLPKIAAFRSFVVNHMIHHRGQLSVYLRLNDIAVPVIYGPTADEG
jgi:uncharacterized damage-inducible protein DinB